MISHHVTLEINKVEELERYRRIFENLLDGIVTLDLNGNVTSANNVVLSYGYEEEELIGKNVLEFITEKYWPMIHEHLMDLREGKSAQGEVELKTKQGILMAEFRSSPIKEEGEVIGFLSIIRDITEMKRAEQRLRESEERLRQLIEYAPDSIYITDLYGNFIDGNKQAEQMVGYKKEELIGKNMLEVGLLPEKYLPKAAGLLEKNLGRQRTGPDEFELIRKDGTTVTVEISSFPIEREGKVEVMGIARDITERNNMEKALLESEAKYRTLFERANDAFIYANLEGNLADVNPKTEELAGFKKEDVLGKPFWELGFLSIEDLFKLADFQSIHGPRTGLELAITKKNGEKRFIEVNADSVRKDGIKLGFVAVVRDVTERKTMQEKLKEYAEHLEEMVKERTRELKESQERLIKSERLAAIGQLATMVGHDLRNPLTSIQNASYYLKVKLDASQDENMGKMLEIIGKEINHANNIIKDLLDFSRVKKPELKKLDLTWLIQDTLEQLKLPPNIKLTTNFSPTPIIQADPHQLRRIFENITLNGIQAMPNGGELTVSTKQNDDFVEIAFTDTGVGIPDKNMDKLFTPLFTTKAQGVGLGLAICKNIVESHNGRIEATSKVGQGSTFTVKLPIQQTTGGENKHEESEHLDR
jgi:PAS domain S-box-containing protein